MATQVILIRHGQTGWNVEARFRGTADVELNETGIAQAEAVARRLEGEPLDAVYTSPLRRAVQTAEIVARPHGKSPQVVPGLSSVNYGEWEGMLERDVAAQYPDLYALWGTHPERVRFPGGESLDQLRDRAMAALMDILAQHRDGSTLAVVTHQIVTRVVLLAVLGLSNADYWRLAQDTACINRFSYGARGFRLLALNDTCHLGTSLPLVLSAAKRRLS